MTYKVDLHTHSTASPDGGISAADYRKALDSGLLDYIAVTDHNSIDFALKLQQELGDKIIVGEEIMTGRGEIVGLFLKELVPPHQSLADTIANIKQQGGLVYVPHPFETVRKGLHPADLEAIEDQVDIVEVCNGRAFAQNRSQQAFLWSRLNHTAGAASSDAHGFRGLGKTYTLVSEAPTAEDLAQLVGRGTPITDRPGVRALLYPKYNRLRKRLRKEPS